MASLNRVQVIGYLGADPELRHTQAGKPVCNFRMASSEVYYVGEGEEREKHEETEWHPIVVWGKLAEVCSQHIAKGRQVYVEGKLKTRKWEDKDNVTRYTTEIHVSGFDGSKVLFLGPAPGSRPPAPDDGDAPPTSKSFDDVPF